MLITHAGIEGLQGFLVVRRKNGMRHYANTGENKQRQMRQDLMECLKQTPKMRVTINATTLTLLLPLQCCHPKGNKVSDSWVIYIERGEDSGHCHGRW